MSYKLIDMFGWLTDLDILDISMKLFIWTVRIFEQIFSWENGMVKVFSILFLILRICYYVGMKNIE